MVWRQRVLQAVHAGPVRRRQHVQREHDGHRHGGRVRGRAVHRGQAVLSGRQGLPPGGHAGSVPGRSNSAVSRHGENVHRGSIVSGHVRVRQYGAGRAFRRGRDVLFADAVCCCGSGRAHVQTAAARLSQKTASGRWRRRLGQSGQQAAGPVWPQARYRCVVRPHVQAAIPAGAMRAWRMGGAGPR